MVLINEFQIGLDLLVGAGSGLIGAMGAYYKLKSRLDMQEVENISQEKEIDDLKERKKEMNAALHKRIDDQNHVIQDIQKEMVSGHQKLETNMAQMELRIVKEIQAMVEKILSR
tara:strand:+ start:892 stop:1233 length:342 start_codon:yes stop_codon:yes gene_type:complete